MPKTVKITYQVIELADDGRHHITASQSSMVETPYNQTEIAYAFRLAKDSMVQYLTPTIQIPPHAPPDIDL